MKNEIRKFITDQLSVWPLAAANFRALKKVRTRSFNVGGLCVKAQFNPCRIVSSTAEVDRVSIAARPCFLCPEHRPSEQFHLPFEGRKGRRYHIQVNPYPIFPRHLVIARDSHIPQEIWHHLPDMLDFACKYPEYTVFYNGPHSGASAPDHLHFQACPRKSLPLEVAVGQSPLLPLASLRDAEIFLFPQYAHGIFVVRGNSSKSVAKLFYRLLESTDKRPGDGEPRFNLFAWYDAVEQQYTVIATMRSELRSHHYGAQGREHLTMSPGAADMAGMFVVPCEEDFEKLDAGMLESMLSEVSISEQEQQRIVHRLTRRPVGIDVGIMSGREIRFEIISDGAGPQTVRWKDGRIEYNGTLYDELYFDAVTRSTLFAEPSFVLYGVTIGVDFHWQRRRDLKYAGALRFIADDEKITAVNHIGVENYLLSVISSEMKSSAPLELLKAHAVISRSWVYSRISDMPHRGFTVCADDHCQRYQGLTMAVGENVRKAIDESWGQVLKYDGELCDTRYSKCCGGTTELFSSCWDGADLPYLVSKPDAGRDGRIFCNCSDAAVLGTVLNDYDLETADFYTWEQRYGREELSELLRERTGIDFGRVSSLEAVQTGPSGRIIRLRVTGDRNTAVIGKELAIRRALSRSHLKSSAFTVEREGDTFILRGRGWGHGVGLCQIGAAAMAAEGYDYREILSHYYPGSKLCNIDE